MNKEERLLEIMRIAGVLSWIAPNPKGYPLMQGSEVEKCILMALDDEELARFQKAASQVHRPLKFACTPPLPKENP